MSAVRKEKAGKARRKRGDGAAAADDKGFQDRLMGLLEWLADKDPVRAARLVGDYLDDLAEEMGQGAAKPAKG